MPSSDSKSKIPMGFKLRHTLRGHTGAINRLSWSPNGQMLASSSEDRTVRIWDATNGLCVNTLEGHGGWVWNVIWIDQRTLLSASEDSCIMLWRVREPRPVRKLEGH